METHLRRARRGRKLGTLSARGIYRTLTSPGAGQTSTGERRSKLKRGLHVCGSPDFAGMLVGAGEHVQSVCKLLLSVSDDRGPRAGTGARVGKPRASEFAAPGGGGQRLAQAPMLIPLLRAKAGVWTRASEACALSRHHRHQQHSLTATHSRLQACHRQLGLRRRALASGALPTSPLASPLPAAFSSGLQLDRIPGLTLGQPTSTAQSQFGVLTTPAGHPQTAHPAPAVLTALPPNDGDSRSGSTGTPDRTRSAFEKNPLTASPSYSTLLDA